MAKKIINYQNIAENIRREREEVLDDKVVAEQHFASAEQVLQAKYKLKRPPFIREAVSTTQVEIDLMMSIRGKVALLDPLNIPSKSEIYRAAIQALSYFSAEEVKILLKSLK